MCFPPGRALLPEQTLRKNTLRFIFLWIFGYIGAASGLLILPVAKSSSETVASSLNFGNHHPGFSQRMPAFVFPLRQQEFLLSFEEYLYLEEDSRRLNRSFL